MQVLPYNHANYFIKNITVKPVDSLGTFYGVRLIEEVCLIEVY